ncbi:uncharacterized protein [Solanum tuberosum]|uniref:Senescence regulator n=1 Tax=Solanum tuberosum TaxID=4113 RepID=M1AE36_SOLTU|nr:PREDICTED: uncharacterized protein LOC102589274 [Solanum tuberosum]
MAASKSYFARSNYRFLSSDRNVSVTSDTMFELDESDVWNSPATARSSSPEFRKTSTRISRKQSIARSDRNSTGVTVKAAAAASSMPVNVPDWSKILKDEYRENRRRDSDDDGEDDDDAENRIPPHEFLARQFARTRIASFSVHEGVGRTLKGRDLSRVRNAIFEKTGFED